MGKDGAGPSGPYQTDLTAQAAVLKALGLVQPPGPRIRQSEPRQPQTIDTGPISAAEFAALDAAMPSALWRTFYRLLWHTGFRVSEALALTRTDFADGAVVVGRLKRRRDVSERIPLPGWLLADCVALTHHKRPQPFPHTPEAARLALRHACERAHVPRALHPHNYRHAFAVRFAALDLGLTPLEHRALLSRMLGLANTAHVDRYFEPGLGTTIDAWAKLAAAAEKPS